MFGLFSAKNNKACPIDLDMRLWLENSFLWLATQFDQDNIATKPMVYPTPEHFPIRYDGTIESLTKTAEIVARQMEIDFNTIVLKVYEDNIREVGGNLNHRIWTEVDKSGDETTSAGMYFEKNEKGQFEIFIEKSCLNNPENMVAVIAHEFSHIKILGENRLDFNDEQLTDLTTVVFGLGIFNANTAYREWKSFESYGHSSIGYLKQREWGYALALYAYFREEEKSEWIKYLTPNVKSDFKKSMAYIAANKIKVFQEEYPPQTDQSVHSTTPVIKGDFK